MRRKARLTSLLSLSFSTNVSLLLLCLVLALLLVVSHGMCHGPDRLPPASSRGGVVEVIMWYMGQAGCLFMVGHAAIAAYPSLYSWDCVVLHFHTFSIERKNDI